MNWRGASQKGWRDFLFNVVVAIPLCIVFQYYENKPVFPTAIFMGLFFAFGLGVWTFLWELLSKPTRDFLGSVLLWIAASAVITSFVLAFVTTMPEDERRVVSWIVGLAEGIPVGLLWWWAIYKRKVDPSA